jgi:hypothetical protein
MSAAWHAFLFSLVGDGPPFVTPRRECAPAWHLTFFAGAKKVSKETPNTSLFERWWPHHLTQLQRVVRFVATSIHGRVNDLFFQQHRDATFSAVIPAKAGMTKIRVQLWHEVLPRKSEPKTSHDCQWPLAEPRPHVCAPAPSYLSPNKLVLGVSLVTFFAPAKKVTRHAGANSRRGAKRNDPPAESNPKRQEDERSSPC